MFKRTLVMTILCMLVLGSLPALAQEDPPPVVPPFLQPNTGPTDSQQQPPAGLPFGQTVPPVTNEQPAAEQPAVVQPAATEEVTPAEVVPEAEPELTIVEPLQISAQQIAINARLDLELMADVMMNGTRPEGWNGSLDPADPSFAINARVDLELLAASLVDPVVRPDGWFGVVASSSRAIARDIRHDLELLADATGFQRPDSWTGDIPLMRCDRATQAMVQFLELNDVFVLQADPTSSTFCQEATNQASLFMEVNLLANPSPNSNLSLQGVVVSSDTVVNSEFAAAFLDRGASRRAGVVPNETVFEPVGRSPSRFSNMLLIRGDGFEVYVDYQFTSITAEEFEFIEAVNDETVETFCTARWCNFN